VFVGGANGLGRATAERLAQENCNIVIADLNLPEAQRTATEIAEKFQVKTAAFKVDVSKVEEIQQLKIDIEKTMGFVDILVNNAGILSSLSLLDGQPKDVQKIIDVNLTSHFWVRDLSTTKSKSDF
jgi:all-trans-retinol dehydrogenase (NAD+)